MVFARYIKTVFTVVAIVAAIASIVDMTPTRAAASECHQSQADSDHSHQDSAARQCCSTAHCCPLVPELPVMTAPAAAAPLHLGYVRAERALLLVKAIDPPPRRADA